MWLSGQSSLCVALCVFVSGSGKKEAENFIYCCQFLLHCKQTNRKTQPPVSCSESFLWHWKTQIISFLQASLSCVGLKWRLWICEEYEVSLSKEKFIVKSVLFFLGIYHYSVYFWSYIAESVEWINMLQTWWPNWIFGKLFAESERARRVRKSEMGHFCQSGKEDSASTQWRAVQEVFFQEW